MIPFKHIWIYTVFVTCKIYDLLFVGHKQIKETKQIDNILSINHKKIDSSLINLYSD